MSQHAQLSVDQCFSGIQYANNSIHAGLCAAVADSGIDESNNNVRIINYVDSVVPLYSPDSFKSHFRMRRSSFEVCALIDCRSVHIDCVYFD